MKYVGSILLAIGLMLSLSSCGDEGPDPELSRLMRGTWQRVVPVEGSSYSYQESYEFKAKNTYTFTRTAISDSDGELLGYHIIVQGRYYIQEGALTFFSEQEFHNTNTINYYSALEALEHRITNREKGSYSVSLEDNNKELHLTWNGLSTGIGKPIAIYQKQE